MNKQQTICVVDDDEDLTRLFSQYLSSNNYQVTVVHDGLEACQLIPELQPDLVILDVMLPSMDGLSVCRTIKTEFDCPILMLTALEDDIDQVAGLEIGADDYMSKPISPRVLLARVRSLLRRFQTQSQKSDESQKGYLLCHGDLEIDSLKQKVTYRQQAIALSSTELRLLWVLASHPGQVLSREELYQKLFESDFNETDRRVDLSVSRIRKQFEMIEPELEMIKTIRNQGYLFSQL